MAGGISRVFTYMRRLRVLPLASQGAPCHAAPILPLRVNRVSSGYLLVEHRDNHNFMPIPITRAILKCRKPSDNYLLLRLAPSWALLQMNLRLSHDFLLVSIRPDVCVITNLSLLFQITLKSNVE
jgi:hypothetical protein